MSNPKRIADLITDDPKVLTESFNEQFNKQESLFVMRPSDDSFWFNGKWESDPIYMSEAKIATIGEALIIAEEVDGCICEAFGRFRFPNPKTDPDGFVNELRILAREIRAKAAKKKVDPRILIDRMIKKVLDIKGQNDLTDLVKEKLQNVVHKRLSKLHGNYRLGGN